MSLAQSLDRIVDIFEHRGVSMRQHLRPGLSRAEVQSVLSPLGLIAPEELYELYEWHDGVDDLYEPGLLLGEHQFLPLKEAAKEYPEVVKYYNYDDPSSLDLTKWFPFASFDGSYFGVYCDPTPFEGLQYPVIRVFEGVNTEFENIDRMVETVLEWIRLGVYGTDETLGHDDLRFAIRKRFNPRIDYGSLPSSL